MIIPADKINEAKAEYDGQAIKEIMEHFGYEYDGKKKAILCPFHNDKNASFVWNPKANAFHCFACQKNYDIIDLYLDQGLTFLQAVQKLFDNVGLEYSFGERGKQVKPSYKYPMREIGNDRTAVEEYLAKRKISKKTLDYTDIQSDEKGNIVFHYYDANDVLLNTKYRPSHKIEKGESKCWFQKDADTTPILFNMNRIDPTKPLIVTEGEIDSLSIIEAGYSNVVSVPNGAGSLNWINECWDWLEQFNKIIIWADNDTPGIKMKNECVRRLGSWRTSFIEISDEDKRPDGSICKDANEILYFFGKDKVLEYVNNPIDTPIEGVIDLAMAEDIDYDLMPGLYTKIPELDEKIVKLFYSQLIILTGKSGEGKSSFLSSVIMAQALEQYENVYIYSGELSPSNVKNWLTTSLMGRENITMKNSVVRVFNKEKYAKLKDWMKERVFIHDNTKGIDEDSILRTMEESARKKGCRVFCIDNLMSLNLNDGTTDELKAQTLFVNRLKNFANKFQALVVLVSHPRKGAVNVSNIGKDDIAGSSNIVNLADLVISVKRYNEKEKRGETNSRGDYIKGCEPTPYDVCIEVIKNRINGQVPKIDLYFDFPSMRFYKTPSQLWYRFKFDDNKSPMPNNDPNSHIIESESPLNG